MQRKKLKEKGVFNKLGIKNVCHKKQERKTRVKSGRQPVDYTKILSILKRSVEVLYKVFRYLQTVFYPKSIVECRPSTENSLNIFYPQKAYSRHSILKCALKGHVEDIVYTEDLLKVLSLQKICKRSSIHRLASARGPLEGTLSAEDLWRGEQQKVFHMQKYRERSFIFRGPIKVRLSSEDVVGLIFTGDLQKVFSLQETCIQAYICRRPKCRRPVECLLYRLISAEDLWKVFYLQKTCRRPSKCRRPVEGLLFSDCLWKVFYLQKSCEKSCIFRRSVKGICIEDLNKAFYLQETCRRLFKDLLFTEDLQKVAYLQATFERVSIFRR